MATNGNTTTDQMADSLPTVVAQARVVRKYGAVMPRLSDRVSLGGGMGNDWREISLAQLEAVSITENTEEDNPQQISDSVQTITPSVISVHTVITDRTARNISKNVFAKVGLIWVSKQSRLRRTRTV